MTNDSLTYDSSSGRYYASVSFDGPDSVTGAVVYGVAEIVEEDPVDLPSLGTSIDTDALDNLFRSASDSHSSISVSFEYNDCIVTVSGRGRISFEKLD